MGRGAARPSRQCRRLLGVITTAMSFKMQKLHMPWTPQGLLFLALLGSILCPPASGIMDPSPEEKRLAWKYPDCSHLTAERGYALVDWPEVRRELHLNPYPENMPAVFGILDKLRGGSAEYDEEARLCIMGIPAVFFFLTKWTVDTMDRDEHGRPDEEAVKKVTVQYSIFENYISALHPG
ncbi:unnamed protein product [Polarella glacialis]|uniref:Uncharacterized protein n=1 Tax=Polarella glacialis TaxID=89957 RepID=A0A813IZG6_POLGL|nr:unnamed protein product [Polarella glacialis]